MNNIQRMKSYKKLNNSKEGYNMAGGLWTSQDKVRPGVYVNTVGVKQTKQTGTRGRVLLLDGGNRNWGKNGVIELDPSTDLKSAIGVDLGDDSAKAIRATFSGGARKIIYVNTNDGTKAVVKDDKLPWTFTAKYPGTKGNNIVMDIAKSAVSDVVSVKTIVDYQVVATEHVTAPDQLMGNSFVDVKNIDKDGSIFDKMTGENTYTLTGGTTTANADMASVLSDALESYPFEVATTAGNDVKSNIHSLLAQLIQELRAKEGYHVTAVVPGLPTTAFDSDAVSIVANGVVLADGTVMDTTNACGYFAGASASVSLGTSLTYDVYPDAIDTTPRLSNDSIIDALKAGHVVFTNRRDGSVVIEQDINSLMNVGRDKNASFKKNRTIRTLDYIANHIKDVAEKTFIGKMSNNETGRGLLKSVIVTDLKAMQNANEIEDFQPDDVTTVAGDDNDSVVVNIMVKPVDSIEKIYMTIKSN